MCVSLGFGILMMLAGLEQFLEVAMPADDAGHQQSVARVSICDQVRVDAPEAKALVLHLATMMPHCGHVTQLQHRCFDIVAHAVGRIGRILRDVIPDLVEVFLRGGSENESPAHGLCPARNAALLRRISWNTCLPSNT